MPDRDPPPSPPSPESLAAGIEALRRGLADLEGARRHQTEADQRGRDSAARADAILEAAPEGILAVDRHGRLVVVNRRIEEMFGYARSEMLDQPVEMLLPEAARATHERHRDGFFAHPRSRPMGRGLELAGRRRDGSEFPVEVSLGFSDAAGALQGIAFVTDITERKRMEEALRRSETRARALLDASTEGIVIADREGRISSINTTAEALFGYAHDELVGQPLEALLPDRLRGVHRGHRAAYFCHPQTRPMGRGLDLLARRKDGTEFPVEIGLSYVETDEGTQGVAFVTDISRRLALERAARQSDRLAALGTLSAGIAHEINNPIGIMSSRIELMLLDAEAQALSAEMVEDLRVLHRNAERVARITQGLLSFSRVLPEQRAAVDLNRVVTDTLELVERQMGKQGVEIATTLAADLPSLVGHASALEQVLLNLLTNARDAVQGRGSIRIETRLAPDRADHIVLRVSDTGPGIPPEVLPRIFDPFYTTKPAGTGLGLSVTYGIVHDHQGTVEVESRLGVGTTFVLTFPVRRAD